MNIGYLLTEGNFGYFAIHDIDILPVNPRLNYSYPEKVSCEITWWCNIFSDPLPAYC